jgi:hypothetical protein
VDEEWISLEGTVEDIYHNIDKYKDGLNPRSIEKGFAFLLVDKDNNKIVVIADKDLIMLGLVKIGNSVKVTGWYNDEGIFLATVTIAEIDEEKFDEIKPHLISLEEMAKNKDLGK